MVELGARNDPRPAPSLADEQKTGVIRVHRQELAGSRVRHDRADLVSHPLEWRDTAQIFVWRGGREVERTIVRGGSREHKAVFKLDRHPGFAMDDRRVEEGRADRHPKAIGHRARGLLAVIANDERAVLMSASPDLFGGDWNYKLGLDWEVIEGLRVRSTYGTGFRIPSVPELFGGVSEGNLTTTDPCSRYATSTNATLRANCQASGVPLNYVQLGNTILTTVGGNEDLEPESATTWTAGVVWQPTFTSGLTLTVDYFDIEIKDAIRSIPGSTKLAVCYNSANLSHPFCAPGNFTRSSLTGEVTFLSAQPINTGRETTLAQPTQLMRGTQYSVMSCSLRVGSTRHKLRFDTMSGSVASEACPRRTR